MTDERFLKLWPFKALRPPRLQLLTNSCRFFLALFTADFSRHLLLFISAVRKLRLSSCCITCPLAVSLHLQVVLTVSFFYFSVCFVRCCIFCRLTAFFFRLGMFLYFVYLARHLSRACARLCSAPDLCCEAKQILLHFIKVVAVKKFVVGFRDGSAGCRKVCY